MFGNFWSRQWQACRPRDAARNSSPARRRRRPVSHLRLEELENRRLPSGADPLHSAIPLVLNSGQPQLGTINGTPTYYQFTVTDSGRLVAEVVPTRGLARLSLLSSNGTVLLQSDGQSPSNHNDLLDMHVAGSPGGTTYYLGVQGLGTSTGSYVLTTSYSRASAPFQSLSVGASPWSSTTGDFNGDGKLDLAVANNTSSNVTIYLGQGDGTFAPARQYAIGSGANSIVAGDFNGDGKSDLATANMNDNTVSILLGRGDGTFRPAVDYAAGEAAASVTAGDFNGDSKLDLAVADYGSGSVAVLFNLGDGTFGSPVPYAVGDSPYAIVAGDFNGDGRVDLATANYGSDDVSVLLGKPDGTFTSGSAVSVGHQPYVLVTGDFNRDGCLDLATANYGSNNVSILRGTGTGGFAPQTVLATGAGPSGIVAADFNNDGRLDLATANYNDGTASIFLGLGNSTFTPLPRVAVASAPSTLSAGDFNGDSTLDLVVGDLALSTVRVLLGRGDGSFQTPPPESLGVQLIQPVAADFNGDGRLDLATVDYTATKAISTFLGQGDGTFRLVGKYSAGSDANALAAGDVNSDGIPDLVTANYSTGDLSVLLGNGDGTFGAPTFFTTGLAPTAIALGDLNGDGKLDAATVDSSSNQVSILFGNGRGQFAPPLNYAVGLGIWGVTTADFNHDGCLDLAVTNARSNDVSLFLNRGNGTFAPEFRLNAGLQPQGVVAGDFNGDGNLDLAVANAGSNSVSVFLGDGRGNFAKGNAIPTGGQPYQILGGDFNHDRKWDLATVDYATNTVTVLQGRGDGTFSQAEQVPVGNRPNAAVTGDFNADGFLDIATTNERSSDVSLLLSRPGGIFQAAIPLPVGGGPVAIAAADFNSDGYTDLVTADPVTREVAVSLSNGDGTLQSPLSVVLGDEPVAVVTGDFNNDGRPDVAVADYLSNTLAILLGIGDGTLEPTLSLAVGSHPDALAAGDFNNDGILDLAVANYGSGTVSILVGRGAGVFTAGQQISVGQGPVALTVGDVTNDGKADLSVANSLSRSVSILAGVGDDTFRLINTLALGTVPSSIVVGDFNSDGRLDLAVAGQASNAIWVLLGAGAGTFQAPVPFAAGLGPVALVAGDFGGSGHLDLATASSISHSVTVLLGKADGSVRAQAPFAVSAFPLALLAADFNNDGHLDIATANELGMPISVGLGLGDGTFVDPSKGAHAIRSVPLVSDLNSDGLPDVAIVARNGEILVRFGNPNVPGTFSPPVVLNPNSATRARDLTLVTVNGRHELAALDARDNAISLYAYAGGSAFIRVRGPTVTEGMPARIVAGDLNGDGRQDLVVASVCPDHGEVTVYLQQPDGTFGPASYSSEVGESPSVLAIVNLTGGTGPDIAVTDQDAGQVTILLHAGPIPFTAHVSFRTGTGLYEVGQQGTASRVDSQEFPIALVAGAFTGGATQDLIVLNRGSDRFDVLRGDGEGGLLNAVTSRPYGTGSDATTIVSGDFNGDGIPDLAILNGPSNQVLIYLGDGKGGFVPRYARGPDGQPLGPGAGNAPNGLAVADVDGDGRLDLLVGNPQGDVLTLLGNGDGTFQPYQRLDRHVALAVADMDKDHQFVFADQSLDRIMVQSNVPGQGWQQDRQNGVRSPNEVKLADLNGDGVPDLIVANGGGNDILVYLGLGHAQYGPLHTFYVGTDPTSVTVADLNGNGVPDLVVTDRGSNDVFILYGQGRGADWTLTNGPRLRAGSGPVDAVVCDVNGDGIPDVIVANSQSNNVYVLRGVGQGFFDDREPVTYETGEDPVQVFVGPFDDRDGFDLVTINAGSHDLSFFSGFGPGQTVDLDGAEPVAALVGDFSHDGLTELIVATNDGRFMLLQAGSNGTEITNLLRIGVLGRVSDIALGSVDGDTVTIYATAEGVEAVIPVSFVLDLPASASVDDVLITPVAEFSSLSESGLEVIATLTIRFSDASSVEDASRSGPSEPMAESGEAEDEQHEPAMIAEMDGAAGAAERNALIIGITETPIQQHLNNAAVRNRNRPGNLLANPGAARVY